MFFLCLFFQTLFPNLLLEFSFFSLIEMCPVMRFIKDSLQFYNLLWILIMQQFNIMQTSPFLLICRQMGKSI